MRFTSLFVLAVFSTLILLSCSGSQSPTLPGQDLTGGNQRSVSSTTERVSWGIWDVYIDPETSTVETVPSRGASFECNVVNFLQPPSAPIHLLTIQIDPAGTNFPAGRVACDVAIKHPFPGTKFCGFDVMGIVMGDWPGSGLYSDPDIITSLYPGSILQNPDGYTRWWNMPEFTTYGTLLGYIEGARAYPGWDSAHTLNPFKYFSDDLDPFDAFNPEPSRRGFFSSVDPGLNKRRYELQFPTVGGEPLHFKYAVSASWVSPFDDADPPYEPDDWPITANMPEAYKIGFVDTVSTAYYVSESAYGGDLKFYLEVRDWQVQGSLPNITSEISTVMIESPTLFNGIVQPDVSEAVFAPGNSAAVWIPVSIEDVTPTGLQNQLLIVTVRSGNVKSYEPQIPGISGFEFPDGNLAAYNIFTVPIKDHGPQQVLPIADADATTPTSGAAPLTVHLDPSLSYDPDGVIILYEWDFESDGIYDISSPTPDVIDHVFPWGSHTVRLRVTDNDSLTGMDVIQINVTSTDTGWLQHRSDFSRDGRTDIVGPSTDNVKFSFEVPDGSNKGIIGGIAVDHQGRVVFRSNSSYLYCVNPDGSLAWSYFVAGGSSCHSCPSIGPDDSVYIGNENSEIYHVDSDGNLIWSQAYGYGQMDGGIILQADGTIIFTTEGDRCVKTDPDGNEIWNYDAGSTIFGGPARGTDGTIYFTTTACHIFAVDQDGGLLWETNVGGSYMNAAPAVGPNGVFIGNQSATMFCLNFDGSIKWSTPLGGNVTNVAAVGIDNDVYVGTKDGMINCLDQETGEILWQYVTTGTIGLGSIVLDGGGHVYVGNSVGDVTCVTTHGDFVWMYDTGHAGFTSKSPAISDEGTLYVGNDAGWLWAFQD